MVPAPVRGALQPSGLPRLHPGRRGGDVLRLPRVPLAGMHEAGALWAPARGHPAARAWGGGDGGGCQGDAPGAGALLPVRQPGAGALHVHQQHRFRLHPGPASAAPGAGAAVLPVQWARLQDVACDRQYHGRPRAARLHRPRHSPPHPGQATPGAAGEAGAGPEGGSPPCCRATGRAAPGCMRANVVGSTLDSRLVGPTRHHGAVTHTATVAHLHIYSWERQM
mmetsp:Transcript_17685/g.45276  ORF Transcript_17685/g.45276 Transcript_17685/m.45276 type:complete len:223 (+) Transcript_17685:720-1388(+)